MVFRTLLRGELATPHVRQSRLLSDLGNNLTYYDLRLGIIHVPKPHEHRTPSGFIGELPLLAGLYDLVTEHLRIHNHSFLDPSSMTVRIL